MNAERLVVVGGARVRLPEGTVLEVDYLSGEAPYRGIGVVKGMGQSAVLEEVVDDSERADAPWVCAITSLLVPQELMLAGGRKAFRIDRNCRVIEVVDLNRETKDSDYWSFSAVPVAKAIVLVYEGGALCIDERLKVRWSVQKYFNDELVRIEPTRLLFHSDDGSEYEIAVSDGARRGL